MVANNSCDRVGDVAQVFMFSVMTQNHRKTVCLTEG